MRTTLILPIAFFVMAAASPAAAADWIDPDLRPDGPRIRADAHHFLPGGPFDIWFTHAELDWLSRHGLTLSALTVLHRRATAPPPVTAPPPRRSGGSSAASGPARSAPGAVEVWRPLVSSHFRGEDVDRALRILWCESRGDPSATNSRTGAAGLFQHLPKYWSDRSAKAGWPGADIYHPEANVAVAAWLRYHGGGWRHWTCR